MASLQIPIVIPGSHRDPGYPQLDNDQRWVHARHCWRDRPDSLSGFLFQAPCSGHHRYVMCITDSPGSGTAVGIEL